MRRKRLLVVAVAMCLILTGCGSSDDKDSDSGYSHGNLMNSKENYDGNGFGGFFGSDSKDSTTESEISVTTEKITLVTTEDIDTTEKTTLATTEDTTIDTTESTTGATTESTSENANENIDAADYAGYVDGNIFYNSYFGFEIETPDGWYIADRDDIDSNREVVNEYLEDTDIQISDEESNNTIYLALDILTRDSINVVVMDTTEVQNSIPGITPDLFVLVLQGQYEEYMSQIDPNVKVTTGNGTLMGKDTAYMDVSYTFSGADVSVRQYVIDGGKYWALINVSVNDKSSIDTISQYIKPLR